MADRGCFTLHAKHVRHESFRCCPCSTAGCVVIEILSGDEPRFRIEPVVPVLIALLKVIGTFNRHSRLLGQDNLSSFDMKLNTSAQTEKQSQTFIDLFQFFSTYLTKNLCDSSFID